MCMDAVLVGNALFMGVLHAEIIMVVMVVMVVMVEIVVIQGAEVDQSKFVMYTDAV